jgi:hypothetical protein
VRGTITGNVRAGRFDMGGMQHQQEEIRKEGGSLVFVQVRNLLDGVRAEMVCFFCSVHFSGPL